MVAQKLAIRGAYVPILALSTILAFTPLRSVAFLMVIYVVGRLLGAGFGLVGNFVASFIICSCLVACLAGLAWLLGIALTSAMLVGTLSISLLIGSIASRGKLPPLKPRRSELLNTDDMLALFMGIAAAVILVIPAGAHLHMTKILPLVAAGGDNATHVNLIKLDDLNQGYSIGLVNRVDSSRNGQSYPQGWHINAVLTKWLLQSMGIQTRTPGKTVAFYYLYCVIWFASFVFLVTRLSLYVATKRRRRLKTVDWAKLSILTVCALGICGWFIPSFIDGFQTSLVAWTMLVLEIWLLIRAYEATTINTRYHFMALAALLIAGIDYSWVFLAPVAVVPLAACVIQTLRSTKRWPPRNFIIWVILAGASALFQIYVQLAYTEPTKVPFIDSNGFIGHTSMYALLAVFATATIYVYYNYSNLRLRFVYGYALVALLFSLGLMQHQLAVVHELRYYYFKSTYGFIVLGIILLASLAYELTSRLMASQPSHKKVSQRLHIGIIVLVILFIGTWGYSLIGAKPVSSLTGGTLQGITPGQADVTAAQLLQNPLNGYRLLFIGSCDRGTDIRATGFATALSYASSNVLPDISLNVELSPLNENTLFHEINYFIRTQHSKIIVVSSDQVVSHELMQYLSSKGNANYVQLVELDSTPETESVAQCPNRVRQLTPQEIKSGIN